MLFPLSIIATAALHFPQQATAQIDDPFPVTVSVTSDEAPIRSGPGADFYETNRLEAGETVEVYRIDQSDWLAIRPPRGSFSWVPDTHLRLTENPAVGRVVQTPIKTRVGTVFADTHDVEYISLQIDELVEVYGPQMLSGEDQSEPQKWYKIAPPSGEFRWIHRDHVELPATLGDTLNRLPTSEQSNPANQQNLRGQLAGQATTSDTLAAEIVAANQNDSSPKTTTGSSAAEQLASDLTEQLAPPAKLQGEQIINAEPITIYPLASVQAAQPENQTIDESVTAAAFKEVSTETQIAKTEAPNPTPDASDASVWEAVSPANEVLTAAEPRSFQDRLTALNVMLSQAVLANVGQWQLRPIDEQAEALLTRSQSMAEREQVVSLQLKIEEFDRLQRRRQALNQRPVSSALAVSDSRARPSSGSPAVQTVAYVSTPQSPSAASREIAANKAANQTAQQPISRATPAAAEMPRIVQSDAANLTNSDRAVGARVKSTRVASRGNGGAAAATRSIPKPGGPEVAHLPIQSQHEPADPSQVQASIFDATGRLIPVASRRSDLPPYALTDSSGSILKFVSPAPGLDLSPFINQPVGIIGQVGFLRTVQSPHITARRVIMLQR